MIEKIKLINHSSLYMRFCDDLKILTDPWYNGLAFDGGWSLLYENEEDYIVQKKGLLFFIDPRSREVLQGSVVEFKTEGMNSGLEIINPNTRDKCGCGESFNI